MRRLLLAALLAAGCGTGTDGKPVAPTAPAPEPAPPPTVRAVGQVWSQAFEGSYDTHERIRVVLDFEDRTIVEGEPRLGIQIGEHVRLADFLPPGSSTTGLRSSRPITSGSCTRSGRTTRTWTASASRATPSTSPRVPF